MNKRTTTAVVSVVCFAAIALAFHPALVDFWWNNAGPALTRGLQAIFNMLFGGAVQTVVESDGVLRVTHSRLTLLVAKYCAGFDGILLFTLVFGFAYLLHGGRRRAGGSWVSCFWGGIALMLGVNVARIVGLFHLGLFLNEWFGYERGMALLRGVAHANAGWCLNLGALIWYGRSVRNALESDRRPLIDRQRTPVRWNLQGETVACVHDGRLVVGRALTRYRRRKPIR